MWHCSAKLINLNVSLLSQVKKLARFSAKLKIQDGAECGNKEALLISKMEDDHKKELEKLETEYKRKRDETLEKHDVEKKNLRSEFENTKKVLHQELEKMIGSSAAGHSAHPPPPSNGHLICSSCKPRATKCFCQAMYMGRATAMEQMVRTILNIQ